MRVENLPLVGTLSMPTGMGSFRAPCLPPRMRPLPEDVRARLAAWTRSALGLAASVPVVVQDWTSNDARDVPHRLCLLVDGGRIQLRLTEAAERVTFRQIARVARSHSQPQAAAHP